MSSLSTGKITEDVAAVKAGNVCLFLVKTGDKYLAIDAGTNAGKVAGEMQKLGINPDRVAAVFLTHSDYDHTGGLKLFSQAAIYLSAREEQMINGTTKRFFFMRNKKINAYQLLEDQAEIKIDEVTVKGLHTPGHTPGSMTYLVGGKYLFAGDTISLKEGRADFFIKIFNMDAAAQEQSIRRLAALEGIRWVLTAHFGVTDDFKTAFGHWR